MAEENRIYISTHTGLEIDRAISLTTILDSRLTNQEDTTFLHSSQIEELQNTLITETEVDEKIENAINEAILEAIGGSY